MTSLKGTVLGCITFLITVGVMIMYFSQQDRYALYLQGKGIFVFDRKTATLNYCDEKTCQMIRPNLPAQETEVVMAGVSGLPAQNAVINGSIPVSPPAMVPQQQGMMYTTNQPMAAPPQQPVAAKAASKKKRALATAAKLAKVKADAAALEEEEEEEEDDTEE